MFLTEPQLSLLEQASQKPVDLLYTNILTVSALSARGLATIDYAKTVREITTVSVTQAGKAIARDAHAFRTLPKYQDILARSRRVKKVQKKRAGQ
jgi:hypothetical protein